MKATFYVEDAIALLQKATEEAKKASEIETERKRKRNIEHAVSNADAAILILKAIQRELEDVNE